MMSAPPGPPISPHLEALLGELVVIDLRSTYVCIGKLTRADAIFLEMTDADLHDFRDSSATREIYVYDSARLGVRRNRARVLIRFDEVVAVTPLDAVSET